MKCSNCSEETKLDTIKTKKDDMDKSHLEIKCFSCGKNCSEQEKKDLGLE